MKKPRIVSLFSGIGGLDHGFEAAGFDVAVAIELDTACVGQLGHTTSWEVIPKDIHRVKSEEILLRAKLREGEAAALIGGPPCQPFSKSGYWASGETLRLDDHRAGTLEAYLRVLRDTLPQTFLLENVEGLTYRGKSEGLDLLRRTIDKINRSRGVSYSFQVQKLNAADYGVPQLRERVFVIGHRGGGSFDFPKPTHAPADTNLLLGLEPYRTAWDAIGDLESDDSLELALKGKWADLLPSVPEGENYLWHTERKGGWPLFGWRRRYWNFMLKLAKRLPSWTIQAQPGPATGPFHWKNRRLSQKELCRLQTLPEKISIEGPITVVQKQLGNAVPSALAELLGLEMRRQLLGHRVRRKLRLIPSRKPHTPQEEQVKELHEKYHDLVGSHEAHPGTGLGYAAATRDSAMLT